MKKIGKFLVRSVKKGKMTEEEKSKVLSRVKGVVGLKNVKDCDLVIEAITENAELKKKIFKELDNSCSKKVSFYS